MAKKPKKKNPLISSNFTLAILLAPWITVKK